MSLFIVGLDVSGLNVALPSIQRGLHLSAGELQWVLDAYTLVLAGLLMLSGSVADRVGRKLVFRIGLTIFGIGSILCAFATSGDLLIASRALQAIGGSMLNPVAMSIITNNFPDPRERAQAIGFWGATIGVSMALGPLIGGVLVQWIGWQAIFWINVPVVATALVLTTLFVPESRSPHPRALDPGGQFLVMVMLLSLVFAIIEGRTHGWTSPEILGCFVLAAVTLAAFVALERRVREPLVDPRFFRSIPFSAAGLAAIIGFAAQGGFLLINTLYLQSDRGLSPLQAGLMTLPLALCNALFAPLSGRLTGTIGPRVPMLISGVLIAASSLVLTGLRTDSPVALIFVAYLLFGSGFGLLNAPITNTAMDGMPRAQAGVAAAITSTSRQIGTVMGIAVFGTLAFGGLSGGAMTSLARASHPAWWAMIGCGVALVAIALLATTPAARATSARVREALSVE